MNDLAQSVSNYVADHIDIFHRNRLAKLEGLKLENILKRKNPYLYKAKHIITGADLVRNILDAYLSSQEETLFGKFLEDVAVFVCEHVYGGYKPVEGGELVGIDLIFERDNKLFVTSVKSGPHWGNSDQINRMRQNFQNARKMLQSTHTEKPIIAVNGCCYGIDSKPLKASHNYWKLCGQDFWELISGIENFYIDIIEPLGHEAKQRNEDFEREYVRVVNRFTLNFMQEYCLANGDIDWAKLVQLVSESKSNLSPI